MSISVFIKIIENTPFWVWILFAILIRRGIALNHDGAVSLKKSLIVPSIFILWGVERIFFGFSYPLRSFIVYVLVLMVGSYVGYLLYSYTQNFYFSNGIFMRKGSLVQLWVILINFVIKYILNVSINLNPSLLSNSNFNLSYSVIAGFTVGIFLGGIINTVLIRKRVGEYL